MKLQFPSTNKMKSQNGIDKRQSEKEWNNHRRRRRRRRKRERENILHMWSAHLWDFHPQTPTKTLQTHPHPPQSSNSKKDFQQSFYLKFPISILSNLVDQKVILLYLEALSKYLRLSTGRVCAQFDHFKSPRMALIANWEEASVWMSQVSSGISWMSIRFAKSIYGGNSLDLAKILLNLARSHHISSNKDQI